MDGQDKDVGNFDHEGAVATFQKLITELPPLNRQLLLYILDLLAVFASKSDTNRMNSANLAAIFQPGIISHPNHDMSPNQYRLSQDVLIFLIENQDNFLFGMSGTGVDEKTVKDMESGARPRSSPKVPLGRSASNASAGADSLRKLGRRNSVSSRHSKGSTGPAPSPGTPSTPLASTASSGGVQRSNTVPTKKSPGLASNRFQRPGEPTTPKASTAAPQSASVESSASKSAFTPPSLEPAPQNEVTTGDGAPKDPGGSLGVETKELSGKKPSLQNLPANLVVPPTNMRSPTRERKISNFFARSPILAARESDNEQKDGRQPNKLRKKQRIPGSANESAQSSQNSLQGDLAGHQTFHTPLASPDVSNHSRPDPLAAAVVPEAAPATRHPVPGPVSGGENQEPISHSLKAPRSPETSVRSGSSFSDFDGSEEPGQKGKSRRHRWHFPSSGKKNGNGAPPLAPPPLIGQNGGARGSNSSLGSSSRQRKSFTGESHQTQQTGTDTSSGYPNLSQRKSEESSELLKDSGSEPEKRGLFGKWKAKIAQSKEDKREREAEKERAKSPGHIEGEHTRSKHGLAGMASEHLPHRGRSIEQPRENALPSVSEAPPTETAEAGTGPSLMSPIPPTPVTAIRVGPETSSPAKEETAAAAASVLETAEPTGLSHEQVVGSVPTAQTKVSATSPIAEQKEKEKASTAQEIS